MVEIQSRIISAYVPWGFVPSTEVIEEETTPVESPAKKTPAAPKAKTVKKKVEPVVAKVAEPTTKSAVKARVATPAKAKPVAKKAKPALAKTNAKPATTPKVETAPIAAHKTTPTVGTLAVVGSLREAKANTPKRRLTATPPITSKTK